MNATSSREPVDVLGTCGDDVVALLRAYVGETMRVSGTGAAGGMHPTDMHALAVLYQAQLRAMRLCAGQLGGALGLSSPATSALLARLEAAGVIRRVHDGTDRRRTLIQLEPAAVEDAAAHFRPYQSAIDDTLAAYDGRDRTVIVSFLQNLVRATRDAARAAMTAE